MKIQSENINFNIYALVINEHSWQGTLTVFIWVNYLWQYVNTIWTFGCTTAYQ